MCGEDACEKWKKTAKAFEEQDAEMLEAALAQLEETAREHHMQRCVDAGLWNLQVPTRRSKPRVGPGGLSPEEVRKYGHTYGVGAPS